MRAHKLTAREYKILLKPEEFSGKPSVAMANKFWRRLKTIIAERLDNRRAKQPRYDGSFARPEHRSVSFWDNDNCVLSTHGYSLRERREIDGSAKAKKSRLTLKLRLPDMFVAATSDQRGVTDPPQIFEEDIAPLEVAEPSPQGPVKIALATPRSIRSRFSLSTNEMRSDEELRTSADMFAFFPTLRDNLLSGGGASADALAGSLTPGPEIHEVVFEGAKVKLGDRIDGDFALTLWYFGSDTAKPDVAEISFKCAIPARGMPGSAARRAFDLFVGMQLSLEDILDPRNTSKTALALPKRCAADKNCAA